VIIRRLTDSRLAGRELAGRSFNDQIRGIMIPHPLFHHHAASIVFVGTLFLFGCSGGDGGKMSPPPLGKVQGTIKLDGKPLANARVEFIPQQARASSGMTDASGVYTLNFDEAHKGAAVGEHIVRIFTKIAAGAGQESVPAKYNEKSELKATVKKEGDNSINFELQSK
jgi:hypothetical protein